MLIIFCVYNQSRPIRLWICWCFIRWAFCRNALAHTSHLKGFSPVWVLPRTEENNFQYNFVQNSFQIKYMSSSIPQVNFNVAFIQESSITYIAPVNRFFFTYQIAHVICIWIINAATNRFTLRLLLLWLWSWKKIYQLQKMKMTK